MDAVWILVADKGRARLFGMDTPRTEEMHERRDYLMPEQRRHERDLRTDDRGRVFDSGGRGRTSRVQIGQGHHAMEEPTSVKEKAAIDFAKDIAEDINKAARENAFDKLVIVAEPQFLGMLRDKLDPVVAKRLSLELPKSIAKERADEIRRHLPDRL
jgi:protein required for attachment to host cells